VSGGIITEQKNNPMKFIDFDTFYQLHLRAVVEKEKKDLAAVLNMPNHEKQKVIHKI